jgi:hypothetical protein
MIIYIFKNITSGKKYLGYTTNKIENYLGSGLYWKRHCKKHGGYTKENIEKVWFETFESKHEALKFIEQFTAENPKYWESSEWANLIPENLEKSALKGNMTNVFEKHGNPFEGGSIQKKAWEEGKYDMRDHSAIVKKQWKTRDKEAAQEKLQAGYQKWKKENKEHFIAEQQRKLDLARQAKRLKEIKLEYDSKIYYGWAELSRATGKTKWFLKKDPKVIKL